MTNDNHRRRIDIAARPEPSSPSRSTEPVTDLLRQAIVHGDLPPDRRLVTAELAQQIGTTRAAVRRALSRLEGEGLIVVEHNRGARVRSVSIEEAIEITEARAALEAVCAARAAERSTPAERRRLRSLCEAMSRAVTADDVWNYNELSHAFHEFIRELAYQNTVVSIIEQLRWQSARYRFSVALFPGRSSLGAQEHALVADAIVDRRPDTAAKLMQDHILSLADALRRVGTHRSDDDVTRKIGPLITGGSTWVR